MTIEEAALILGCSVPAVRRHLVAGRLSSRDLREHGPLWRVYVEMLATEVFGWRRHLDDPEPYWVTGQRAADMVGVSRSRLGQLADSHRVPHVRHQDGTRLYRRAELAAVKAARARSNP